MSRVHARGERIRRFILNHVQANPRTISKLATGHFDVSRQATNRHLRRLVEEGALREAGKTSSRTYKLAPLVQWNHAYAIQDSYQAEDVVWRKDIDQVLGVLPDNVRGIWSFGFTEMFNNATDHANGSSIYVGINKTAVATEMMIMDDGIGIFRKIQKELNLLDERHAIFELSKGKLTTDPRHHTGEGIFFTSRMFDAFDILSGGVYFAHESGHDEDWLLERENPQAGTSVFMRLGNHTSRTTRKVFDKFTAGDEDHAFDKTVVPVRLAQYGNDELISRSQAKRVLARIDLFKSVVLDFRNVPAIGQAFADEVFRIFPREHPSITMTCIRENSQVKRMILRAQAVAPSGPISHPKPSDDADDWDESDHFV